jgi:hypothetical protein
MSTEQIQCPNCGGFKTKYMPKDITGSQEKVAEQLPKSNGLLVFAAVLQCLMFLACAVTALMAAMNLTINKEDVPSALAVLAFGMIFSAISFMVTIRKLIHSRGSQNEHVATTRHFYECRICGYKWDWSAGEPVPEVTRRPELIEQGSRLLSAENRGPRTGAIRLSAAVILRVFGLTVFALGVAACVQSPDLVSFWPAVTIVLGFVIAAVGPALVGQSPGGDEP